MATELIPYTNESEWLAARTHDITSTEAAALFALSPYSTVFELFYAKQSGAVPAFADNERMRWGRRLQDPIAWGVADDYGVAVRKKTEYVRNTDARVGASFDFEITGAKFESPVRALFDKHGAGLMEIKTVDPLVFNENWLIADGEVIEAPAHIELQVQHQLLVSGLQWALIVALVGGNRVSVIERAYDPTLGAAIIMAAQSFWALVDAGTPPTPDYSRDSAALAQLYLNATPGKVADLSADSELVAWAANYRALGISEREISKEREILRGRIFERIGDAARVLLPDCAITATTVRESEVAAYTRAAYRNLRVNLLKEKK